MKFIVIALFVILGAQPQIAPENYLSLNVKNETDESVFIYHGETLLFALKEGDKKERYAVDKSKTKSIYAQTYDKSLKWGPIDLTQEKKTFYWKLTLTKKE